MMTRTGVGENEFHGEAILKALHEEMGLIALFAGPFAALCRVSFSSAFLISLCGPRQILFHKAQKRFSQRLARVVVLRDEQ
jgi:hypothetical protein